MSLRRRSSAHMRMRCLSARAELPLGRCLRDLSPEQSFRSPAESGLLLCWCKEVTKKHLESRASPEGPARGFCEGMKAPYTTRPSQADTSFAPLADLSLQAKRKTGPPGTTEFCVEFSSVRNVLVQVLRGMLCLNVLSFGDFSLHEQRKVTRAASGRAEALLW